MGQGQKRVVKVAVMLVIIVFACSSLLPLPYAKITKAAVSHPFLLVSESEYGALRALANSEPWASMKNEAIADANQLTVNTSNIRERSKSVGRIASAAALAYIMDNNGTNRDFYMGRIESMVNEFDANIRPHINNTSWNNAVPPSGAFFNLVLAVDIVHNRLARDGKLTAVESKLNTTGQWFYNNSIDWHLADYGAEGIWAAYTENATKLATAKTNYKNQLLADISADGVYKEGPGYAAARLAGTPIERDAKTYFMDVLEYTGLDNSYYSNAKLQNFYEWLFGYSLTPVGAGNSKEVYTFGDSSLVSTAPGSAAAYRAYRFSDQAAKYAAKAIGSGEPEGQLLYYLLMREALPAPQNPPSRIFPDGGAWLMENSSSSYALTAALWNSNDAVPSGGHRHKDVNAVHMTAYGEHVLRNSGYAGWGTGYGGFTWNYMNSFAESSNTVTINNVDHQHKYGGGVQEGFTSNWVSYASGHSGYALSNGTHVRNLTYVSPQDNKDGYWVLFDEIDATSGGATANIALHPNADNRTTITNNMEYGFTVSPMKLTTNHPVHLSVFYGTAPNYVHLKDGALTSFSGSFIGKSLLADYNTDSNGIKNAVTVLYPHDNAHPKATMVRTWGSNGSTGARMDMGNSILDYALESTGSVTVAHGQISFKGRAAIFRKNNNDVGFYFVRKGTSFDDGAAIRQGFQSVGNISLVMRGQWGRVISGGTSVTFYAPDVKGIKLNGNVQSLQGSGANWVKVNIPSGTHNVELTY